MSISMDTSTVSCVIFWILATAPVICWAPDALLGRGAGDLGRLLLHGFHGVRDLPAARRLLLRGRLHLPGDVAHAFRRQRDPLAAPPLLLHGPRDLLDLARRCSPKLR